MAHLVELGPREKAAVFRLIWWPGNALPMGGVAVSTAHCPRCGREVVSRTPKVESRIQSICPYAAFYAGPCSDKGNSS